MIDLALVFIAVVVIFIAAYALGVAYRNIRRILAKHSEPSYDEVAESGGEVR